MYGHNAQVHCSTNLKTSNPILPRHPTVLRHSKPEGITDWRHSNYISTSITSNTATPHSDNAIRCVQASENGARALQRRPRWKDSHCNRPLYSGQYVYIDRLPMTSSAAEWLCCRAIGDQFAEILNFPKTCTIRIVKLWLRRVTIDENGMSNTVLIYHATLLPTPIKVQDALRDAKSGKEDRLPTDTMGENVHKTPAMRQNVIHNKTIQAKSRQNV